MGTKTLEWTEEQFMRRITERCPDAVAPAHDLLRWAEAEDGITVQGGKGPEHPSLALKAETGRARESVTVARLRDYYPSARLQVLFGSTKDLAPFADERLRGEFYRRFKDIHLTETEASVPLGRLADGETMTMVCEIIRDMARRARG